VIVVDDGSTAPGAIEAVAEAHAWVQLIRQPRSGPATARNAGAANARGGFLCFTDDDCEPHEDWAERLVAALEAGADAAAGKTLCGNTESAIQLAAELIAGAPASAMTFSNGQLSFAPSNNIACRADVFAKVPFDESYTSAAGEDRDWCTRLLTKGYVLRAELDAVLIHRSSRTFGGFVRQQVRYGRGAFSYRRGGSEQRPFESLGFYADLLRRSFAHGLLVGSLVTIAQGATAIGFALEWGAARRRYARVRS
jgi:glycosyltransferase involved in cell wall biosynthesis